MEQPQRFWSGLRRSSMGWSRRSRTRSNLGKKRHRAKELLDGLRDLDVRGDEIEDDEIEETQPKKKSKAKKSK